MFPTPHTVTILRDNPTELEDDYGNPIPAEPIEVEASVYGWAPAGSTETLDRNQQITHDLDLYAGPSFVVTPADQVQIGEVVYAVDGHPQDFNHGPFGWEPGVRVKLTRTTG